MAFGHPIDIVSEHHFPRPKRPGPADLRARHEHALQHRAESSDSAARSGAGLDAAGHRYYALAAAVEYFRRSIACRAARLSTQAIAQTIDTATSGSTASYHANQRYGISDYRAIAAGPAPHVCDGRKSPDSVTGNVGSGAVGSSSLTTTTASTPGQTLHAAHASLSEVAGISTGAGPSQITRQNKQREIDINADLTNTSLGNAVQASTQIMNSIALPAGYYWQFGQSVTQQSQTFSSLGMIVILAVLLIYMLLAAQFESLLHPLVIMMSVPLSLAGVVVALVITHRSFGLTAFIGLLMLVGIVVKNAILVVEFTNQLRHRGLSAREAVLHAAPMRLRPILMTTLATVGRHVADCGRNRSRQRNAGAARNGRHRRITLFDDALAHRHSDALSLGGEPRRAVGTERAPRRTAAGRTPTRPRLRCTHEEVRAHAGADH